YRVSSPLRALGAPRVRWWRGVAGPKPEALCRIAGEDCERCPNSLSAPGGGEGRGEVGDSRAVADSPPHAPSRSALRHPLRPEGRRGERLRRRLMFDWLHIAVPPAPRCFPQLLG